MYIIILFIIFLLFLYLFRYYYYKYNHTFSSNPFKSIPSLFFTDKWVTYNHILGDGSCFYHSVLYIVSKTYRNSDNTSRIDMVHNFRKSIYDYFTFDVWKTYYSHFSHYSSIQNSILYEWAGNIEWKIVSDYLNIQIVIFRESDNSLYWGFDLDNDVKADKRVMFILNTRDSHFEPILYNKSSGYQYIFHMNPSIHSLLKKIKCKN